MAAVPAYAHGYVSFPPSCQVYCRDDQVHGCGSVRYELHGLFKRNGNGSRFPQRWCLVEELLLHGPPGVHSLEFAWTFTAPHSTTTFEYFTLTEDNTLLALFNYHNTTSIDPVVHLTGRQTILGSFCWNVSGNTPNPFYSCVDLHIKSSNVIYWYAFWWCLANPSSSRAAHWQERFLASIHLLSTLNYRTIMSSIQAFPSFSLVLAKDSVKFSVSDFLFVFRRSLTFYYQKTTAPEIPVAVPTVVQVNQTPVRGAINRLGMRIKVMICLLCAFIYWFLFFSCSQRSYWSRKRSSEYFRNCLEMLRMEVWKMGSRYDVKTKDWR